MDSFTQRANDMNARHTAAAAKQIKLENLVYVILSCGLLFLGAVLMDYAQRNDVTITIGETK